MGVPVAENMVVAEQVSTVTTGSANDLPISTSDSPTSKFLIGIFGWGYSVVDMAFRKSKYPDRWPRAQRTKYNGSQSLKRKSDQFKAAIWEYRRK
ncbi:hypothetical protein WG66_008502 [Moniliophthora roreri]|nr:hypothetical protein WG66_008502 [Moniliophthora roreri]